MSYYVVDCSVSAGWYLPDEYSEFGGSFLENIMMGRDTLIVPELWWYENLNVLKSAVARRRITPSGARKALKNLERIPCQLHSVSEKNSVMILDTAMECKLSAYDASYIVAAQECDAHLVTADKDLLGISSYIDCIVSIDGVI